MQLYSKEIMVLYLMCVFTIVVLTILGMMCVLNFSQMPMNADTKSLIARSDLYKKRIHKSYYKKTMRTKETYGNAYQK